MDLLVYDEDDQRYVPWTVAAVAVVVAVVLAAGLSFLAARAAADPTGSSSSQAGGGAAPGPVPQGIQGPSGDQAPTQACSDALRRADVVLERSSRLEQALAEQTRVMDELLAQRLSPVEAQDQALAGLTEAAADRQRFAEELTDYQDARTTCPTG